VTGTLANVFVGVALLCIVAGLAAVTRTRRRTHAYDETQREDPDDLATEAYEAARGHAMAEGEAGASDP
jgi:hypothetical protein